MAIHNADIARALEDIADLLELQEANPFRVRAYRNAARTIQELGLDVAAAIAKHEALPHLPGIGADLAAKIAEIATTGTCALLDELKRALPPAITELLQVPGLGPKRVRALYDHLHVNDVAELVRAAREGRLREVPGFGEKTEQHILQRLEEHVQRPQRFLLAIAAQYALPLAAHLRQAPGVGDVVVAGSFRRMRETVGDIDILATASRPADVMRRFVEYPEVRDVLAHGEGRSSVVLASGLQVDLRVVPAESYGSALHYFTGSKAHNIAIRRLAQERGLKINEYGVFRGTRRIGGDTEESVFAAVGLPFIPPELREDAGEIDAARAGELPRLVELADLRGDLHVHTTASDGRNSIREMALAAKAQGLAYIAVADHSQRLTMAHGLDPARLARQIAEIGELNRALTGITVLTGTEVDILDDGALDLPDAILARLDIVVAAVHGKFDLPRARQTERLLRALESPRVHVLAHPTGRLIGRREPYDVDMLQVVRKAKERGIVLELNAHPERLDLIDAHCRLAKAEGVPVAIDSDAHSVHEFANLRFGIGQARRGWLEKRDVANCLDLPALRRLLHHEPRPRVVRRAPRRTRDSP
jgi:DNA polymerase (family 10)